MILYHKNLVEIVDILNSLEGTPQIQKMYSTSCYVCIALRYPGITQYLYVGRGSRFEGIWLGSSPAPSSMRVKDRFLEYLRKYLKDGRLASFKVHPQDRLLTIEYRKWGKMNYMSFFWYGRELYFQNFFYDIDQEKYYRFCSWKQRPDVYHEQASEEMLYEPFLALGLGQNADLKKHQEEIPLVEELLKLEVKSFGSSRQFKRKIKSQKRKVDNIRRDLTRVQKWKDVEEELFKEWQQERELETSVDIAGVKFKFDRYLNYYQKRDRIYEKLKNLKKAEPFIEERLRKEIDKQVKMSDSSFDVTKKVIQPIWYTKRKAKATGNSDYSYDEFTLKSGISFAIGKNVTGNDYIRNKWAKKNHLWFHLDGDKSAHLIVKVVNFSELDENDKVIIASALADYSSKETMEIQILYTQVKNLKGIKGQAGSVIYKKEKYIKIDYNKDWKSHLMGN